MKQRIDKDNRISQFAKTWKENQGMVSITLDEFKKQIGDKEIFISEKIDGELACCEFNGDAKFGSNSGRIREDLPVLDEIASILKNAKIKQATIMGELAAVSKKCQPLSFNETESIARKPNGQEDKIHFFAFELVKLDSKEVSKTYKDYKETFKQLQKWFDKSEHICPVDSKIGSLKELESAWKKYIEDEKNEGIVVRTSDEEIVKIKPEYTLDLGVIGIQEGTGKNKGTMGALILGFFDGENFYRSINLGVGFKDDDRDEWWELAQKHKIKREDRIIWIDPFKLNKVIETRYERLNIRPVETYQFDKGKKEWIKVENMLAATISKPDFVRERSDKDVNKSDLRLSQIPDWSSMKKQKKASSFLLIGEQIIDDVMKERIDALEEMVDVQCSDGNWNYDDYMHGMANGMIFSLDLIKGINDPQYLEAPKQWLKDK